MKKNNTPIRKILAASVVFGALLTPTIGAQRTRSTAKPKVKPAPVKQPVAERPSPDDVKKQATFKTTGMEEGKLYGYVHDGRFMRVLNDMRLKMMFESYVNAYSGMCSGSLSRNKVEITQYVQTYRQQTTFLPWGRSLIPYTTQRVDSSGFVGTGIYAEPEFADVYSTLTGGHLLDFMRNLRSLNASAIADAIVRSTEKAVSTAIQTYADTNKMLTENGCNSAATKRFSENLLRRIKNQKSVQAANGEKSIMQEECERKLSALLPRTDASSCSCLDRELTANLTPYLYNELEDDFSGKDFGTFLLVTVSRAGLQEKIKGCFRDN